MSPINLLAIAAAIVVAVLLATTLMARIYRKAGPNQALIIYGLGGTRVVIGSGAFVPPLFSACRELSLSLMSFDVAPQKELFTTQGVAVNIEAVTQIKIKSDLANVKVAAEQFLNKADAELEGAIRLVMEGHLRGIVGQLTVEQIVKEPEMVGDKVRSTCAGDLAKMGLEMISFTIKDVRDKNRYIENMGRPEIERITMQANIAAAEAQRDTQIKQAEATRDAAMAQANAEQQRVIAETESRGKQAEAQRDLEIKQAEYAEIVQRAKAQADKSYEIQTNVMQQQVVVEQLKIQQIERMQQVKLQETEIARRENELIATELKSAEIEAKRQIALAEAARTTAQIEADGKAAALRTEGMAQADVLRKMGEAEAEILRIRGAAEADVVRAKGEAEAQALESRAKAFLGYNQAAVLDKVISGLPEVVRAVSEPLAKVDRITVVSTGDGGGNGGTGVSRVTADVARMVAQVPDIVESLSGISLNDLLKGLPRIKAAAASANPVAERAVPAVEGANGNLSDS